MHCASRSTRYIHSLGPAAFCADDFQDTWELSIASTDLLLAAARLGHASAAQQLLLFDPRANAGHSWSSMSFSFPAHQAALHSNGAAVLKLLLAAAPELVHTSCTYEDSYGHLISDWTLLHSAASSDNIGAVRLLLLLHPELASASNSLGHLPSHVAAFNSSVGALRLLIDAAPETAIAADPKGWLPAHTAAAGCRANCLRILSDAGALSADVPTAEGLLALHIAAGRAGSEQDSGAAAVEFLLAANPAAVGAADKRGRLPLHQAAVSGCEAAVRLLLAANPAAALVQDSQGRTPMQLALHYGPQAFPAIKVGAARALLSSCGMRATQLLDMFAAVPQGWQDRMPPLYADLAAHLTLAPAQWQRVPTPCPGLGRALPAVLTRSEAEAARLVAHLPPAEAACLRTAALCLHRLQRSLQLEAAVPAPLLGRILALSLADA